MRGESPSGYFVNEGSVRLIDPLCGFSDIKLDRG